VRSACRFSRYRSLKIHKLARERWTDVRVAMLRPRWRSDRRLVMAFDMMGVQCPFRVKSGQTVAGLKSTNVRCCPKADIRHGDWRAQMVHNKTAIVLTRGATELAHSVVQRDATPFETDPATSQNRTRPSKRNRRMGRSVAIYPVCHPSYERRKFSKRPATDIEAASWKASRSTSPMGCPHE
jgi:hypothetical protein